MSKKILLIGGGGHCKSVLDCLLNLNEYVEIGIVDKKENIGNSILGVSVIACDDDLPKLYKLGFQYAFITLGSIGDPSLRVKLFKFLVEIGFEIPNIIDSSAKISNYVEIGKGVFIGKQSIVNAGSTISDGVIINSGSIVEHDCNIGAFVHIAPGVVLGGNVTIGENSHIGSNASVIQQVSIGSNSIIGIGSVVLENMGDTILAFGNPCKEVKRL